MYQVDVTVNRGFDDSNNALLSMYGCLAQTRKIGVSYALGKSTRMTVQFDPPKIKKFFFCDMQCIQHLLFTRRANS